MPLLVLYLMADSFAATVQNESSLESSLKSLVPIAPARKSFRRAGPSFGVEVVILNPFDGPTLAVPPLPVGILTAGTFAEGAAAVASLPPRKAALFSRFTLVMLLQKKGAMHLSFQVKIQKNISNLVYSNLCVIENTSSNDVVLLSGGGRFSL